MGRIVLHKFGHVEEGFAEELLKVIRDCYDRVKADEVKIIDLILFDESSKMNVFLNEEKRKLGIKTSAFEGSYTALHDAWHGTPRIMVAHDKFSVLPVLVRIGSLRHEVGHTILHGSLEFYSFPLPASLLRLEDEGVVSRRLARDILYLASVAVKDFEVTRLLYENGFVEDQVAFNEYFLKPLENEREAWGIGKNDTAATLLVLGSLLKTVCCAAPLLIDSEHGNEIYESIENSMSHLPTKTSRTLLRIVYAAFEFGRNTHENVNSFLSRIVAEPIIEKDHARYRENG